jgi:hypothetical protein
VPPHPELTSNLDQRYQSARGLGGLGAVASPSPQGTQQVQPYHTLLLSSYSAVSGVHGTAQQLGTVPQTGSHTTSWTDQEYLAW